MPSRSEASAVLDCDSSTRPMARPANSVKSLARSGFSKAAAPSRQAPKAISPPSPFFSIHSPRQAPGKIDLGHHADRGKGQADQVAGHDQEAVGDREQPGQLSPAEARGQGQARQGRAADGEAAADRDIRLDRPGDRGHDHDHQDDQKRLSNRDPDHVPGPPHDQQEGQTIGGQERHTQKARSRLVGLLSKQRQVPAGAEDQQHHDGHRHREERGRDCLRSLRAPAQGRRRVGHGRMAFRKAGGCSETLLKNSPAQRPPAAVIASRSSAG